MTGVFYVIFQKRVQVFHRGFKHEKTDESTRPQANTAKPEHLILVRWMSLETQ